MTKKIIIGIVLVVIGFGLFKFFDKNKPDTIEQQVYSETLSLSTEYTSLRYQTENVLEKAKDFDGYNSWKAKMEEVVKGWQDLEKRASELEKMTSKITVDKVGFEIISPAIAYDSQEVSRVINSGSMKNQISRLAKHFGVDAKRAQLILNETQDRVSNEAYTEEGDVFEECEQNSMRIKNGAKITVFVGGVVLTGGASAVVTSGALATTATVVVGADLVLEVTEDEARIALGDRNKVSEMVSGLRSVTEPAAAILSLTNIPGNLSKGIDKLSALSFGADQVRSVIQDEKVLGISIKTDEKGEVKAEIAGVTQEELSKWREENKAIKSNESVEEIINNAKMVAEKETVETEKENETKQAEDKKEATENNTSNTTNQIIKIVNVSSNSFMMDTCFNPTCWDDLAANPAEDRDIGGIYTMGKVYGQGESFRTGFRPSDLKKNSQTAEMLKDSYRVTLYFAIAPFEGPKNKTIDYGTWLSESVEINAKYGDEPVVEWDGSSLKQVK